MSKHADAVALTAARASGAAVATRLIADLLDQLAALNFYDEQRDFIEQARHTFRAMADEARTITLAAVACPCSDHP